MTANQVAYQANKIKEMEAETKRGQLELDTSQHLHEYGYIWEPAENARSTKRGTVFGTKKFEQMAGAINKLVSPFGKMMG